MTKVEMLTKVETATVDYHRGLTTFDEYILRIKDIALAHALDEYVKSPVKLTFAEGVTDI